jgi:hypothetical protein
MKYDFRQKTTAAPSAYRQNYTPYRDKDVIMAVLVGVVFLVVMPVLSWLN